MRITVYYKSGEHQAFIVPKNIYATEFRKIAEKIGGRIKNIVFSNSSDINTFKHRVRQ